MTMKTRERSVRAEWGSAALSPCCVLLLVCSSRPCTPRESVLDGASWSRVRPAPAQACKECSAPSSPGSQGPEASFPALHPFSLPVLGLRLICSVIPGTKSLSTLTLASPAPELSATPSSTATGGRKRLTAPFPSKQRSPFR